MKLRYRPVTEIGWYFAKDGSGIARYSEATGDTHFLHIDSNAVQGLLSGPGFSPEELGQTLSLDASAAAELIDQLLVLGLIDEIG